MPGSPTSAPARSATAGPTVTGTWLRRVFASRADRVVVHELLPAAGQTLDATLRVNTGLEGAPGNVGYTDSATVAGGSGYLDVRGTYPSGGAYGFEGVTRVVASGGQASVTVSGSALVVSRATRILLLTKLDRYETAGGWNGQPLQAALAALPADYAVLLGRHVPPHQAMYDRSGIDLGVSAADRQLSTSELIARQKANTSVIDLALLERLYDSGRYLFVSSSGILPPRLTGIWTGAWTGAWADDFTTDANINLQVAGGNILDLGDAMQGYFAPWSSASSPTGGRTPAGSTARAASWPRAAPTASTATCCTSTAASPGHCWTGGADWLLYPLLEYYQVTGDTTFLRDQLGPALIELALFYEDFLTRTDSDGKVVFVPSFSMENPPASTGRLLAINATGDIMAGRHALRPPSTPPTRSASSRAPGRACNAGPRCWPGSPATPINGDGALAEWSWPGLTDHYNHRHVHHLYGAWPLHEINPEDRPDLVRTAAPGAGPARRREPLGPRQPAPRPGPGPAQGRRRRVRQPAEDPRQQHGVPVADDLPQPEPGHLQRRRRQRHARGARRGAALHPARRPGAAARATGPTPQGDHHRGPRSQPDPGREAHLGHRRPHRHRHPELGGRPGDQPDLPPGHRLRHHLPRGHRHLLPLGNHARVVALPAATTIQITVGLSANAPAGKYRLVNRNSGKVIDVNGGSTADGARIIQWTWTGATNQQWTLEPNPDGSYRLRSVSSGKVLHSAGGSAQGAALTQSTDTSSDNQWWKLVPASTSGYHRLVNVRNGWCADVSGASTADGGSVIQWSPGTGANQEWQLIAL